MCMVWVFCLCALSPPLCDLSHAYWGCVIGSPGLELQIVVSQISHGSEVTDSCEPPYGCWELNLSLLEEKPILLTAEVFFSPVCSPVIKGMHARTHIPYLCTWRVCVCLIVFKLHLFDVWMCSQGMRVREVGEQLAGGPSLSCILELRLRLSIVSVTCWTLSLHPSFSLFFLIKKSHLVAQAGLKILVLLPPSSPVLNYELMFLSGKLGLFLPRWNISIILLRMPFGLEIGSHFSGLAWTLLSS